MMIRAGSAAGQGMVNFTLQLFFLLLLLLVLICLSYSPFCIFSSAINLLINIT